MVADLSSGTDKPKCGTPGRGGEFSGNIALARTTLKKKFIKTANKTLN
jgi:hypothetical protein